MCGFHLCSSNRYKIVSHLLKIQLIKFKYILQTIQQQQQQQQHGQNQGQNLVLITSSQTSNTLNNSTNNANTNSNIIIKPQHQQQLQQGGFVAATSPALQSTNVLSMGVQQQQQQQVASSPQVHVNQSSDKLLASSSVNSTNSAAVNSLSNITNRTLTPTPPSSSTNNIINPANVTPTSGMNANTGRLSGQPAVVNQTGAGMTSLGGTATPSNPTTPMDLLKYLRNFLHTLLNLARNSVPDKYPLVRSLIQDLLVSGRRYLA